MHFASHFDFLHSFLFWQLFLGVFFGNIFFPIEHFMFYCYAQPQKWFVNNNCTENISQYFLLNDKKIYSRNSSCEIWTMHVYKIWQLYSFLRTKGKFLGKFTFSVMDGRESRTSNFQLPHKIIVGIWKKILNQNIFQLFENIHKFCFYWIITASFRLKFMTSWTFENNL